MELWAIGDVLARDLMLAFKLHDIGNHIDHVSCASTVPQPKMIIQTKCRQQSDLLFDVFGKEGQGRRGTQVVNGGEYDQNTLCTCMKMSLNPFNI